MYIFVLHKPGWFLHSHTYFYLLSLCNKFCCTSPVLPSLVPLTPTSYWGITCGTSRSPLQTNQLSVLYCNTQDCTVPQWYYRTALHCIALYSTAQIKGYYSVTVQCSTALHCTVLHFAGLACSSLGAWCWLDVLIVSDWPGGVNGKPHLTALTLHCTLHTAHCTLHTEYCILHTKHLALHTAHCTINTAQCTLHTALYTLHNIYTTNQTLNTENRHFLHCTLNCTLNCTLHTIHSHNHIIPPVYITPMGSIIL